MERGFLPDCSRESAAVCYSAGDQQDAVSRLRTGRFPELFPGMKTQVDGFARNHRPANRTVGRESHELPE